MRRFLPLTRETQVRLVRFLIVGGGSAGAQFLMLAWMKLWMSPTLAFSVSWVLSAAMHYFANRYWAMPSGRHDTVQQLGEYLFALVVSYVINVGAFKFFHDFVGLSVMWAAFWSIPPSTGIVFLLLNFRVFRARV
jgi:putative flippase GtrA